MDFDVDPAALKQYAGVLKGLDSSIDAISEYMHNHGCNKSGFTGLFMVLQPVVDLVGSLYGETLKFGKQRLASLAQGVEQTAAAYQQADDRIKQILADLLKELDTAEVPTIA